MLGMMRVPLCLLLLQVGCATECRDLCTAWYDYRTDVCGELQVDDDRVACIADYTTRLVDRAERDECSERRDDLRAVRDGDDPQACCPGSDGCPWSEP